MVNWEASSSDGERFNSENVLKDGGVRKGLACYEEYLIKKEKRQKAKNLAKIKKAEIKKANLERSTTVSNSLN